jgi:hypothetical protein
VSNWVEINDLKKFIKKSGALVETETLAEVKAKNETLPIQSIRIGTTDPAAPTVAIIGGVHGLERVGSHVVTNYLSTLVAQLRWDKTLQKVFENFRLVSIPILNPGGMFLSTRCNPNGVDIMRNGPDDANGKTLFLASGHRISPKLPWYRGKKDSPPEIETTVLLDFLKSQVFPSKFSMSIDIHSGFGAKDRLWFPYSRTQEKFPYYHVVEKFGRVLDTSMPYHVYNLEAQSESYLIHGDPWDHAFELHNEQYAPQGNVFIPWCLEMGSWTWLKKNPRQIFSAAGIFNPLLPHRYARIMRRHRGFLDFLRQAVIHHEEWNRQGSNSQDSKPNVRLLSAG